MKIKIVLAVLTLSMVLGCAVGGTLAWLMDKDSVTNTFVAGNVNLELTESTGSEYKMIPGATITKDPKVTVKGGSEACWLFIKIDEINDVDHFLTYAVADSWQAVPGTTGVYYIKQAATTADVAYYVLAGDKVTVNATVTKADMDQLTTATLPKLTFTAYAIQQLGFDTVTAAWAEASTLQ